MAFFFWFNFFFTLFLVMGLYSVSVVIKKIGKHYFHFLVFQPAETLLRLYVEQRREGSSPKRNTHKFRSAASNGMTYFTVEELTKDHHLDRDDEKFRVENAGGYVTEWGGVPRVNGQLVVSRSIGDVNFKR